MKRSKNVRAGRLCAWKGDKLILAGKRSINFAGIWTMAGTRIIIDENFERHKIDNPTGLQIYGAGEVAFLKSNGTN